MSSHNLKTSLFQAEELTGLFRRDMESSLVLASSEDERETESSLDLQGRRHVNTCELAYHGYTLQSNPPVSCNTFEMPGIASANALRHFLRHRLQPHQIVDEYGDECDISEVSSDHLASLQAKVWSKTSNDCSPVKPAARFLSKAQAQVANHDAKMSRLLEEKHVFVLSDAAPDSCLYRENLPITAMHICSSSRVRLEPLVHWGTVTPVIASSSALFFRRDGELMQQPEYLTLVRRLVPPEGPTYCIKCWNYIQTKRNEAQETMKQLKWAVQQPEACVAEDALRSPSAPDAKDASFRIGGKITPVVERLQGLGYHAPSLKPAELCEASSSEIIQLDGGSDQSEKPQFLQASSNKQHHDTICISSDSEDAAGHCVVPTDLASLREPFTLPLRITPLQSESPEGKSAHFRSELSHEARAFTATETEIDSKISSNRKTEPTRPFENPLIIDLITPPRVKQRKFGREIDANTKGPSVPLRRSPRNHKTSAVMSQENLPPPVRPMKSLKVLSEKEASTKVTKKRQVNPAFGQGGKPKKPRTMEFTQSVRLQPAFHHDTIVGIPRKTEVGPAPSAPAPPPPIVHFAKRPAILVSPDTTPLIYEDLQNTTPALDARICFCDKPAGLCPPKKNSQPQIAQCNNLDCRFRWYHYACLNLSDKGRARFGNLLCQHCRNEREFDGRNKENDVVVKKLMDFEMPWTHEDIEAILPGPGGHGPVINPYGLGMNLEIKPAHRNKTQTQSTLGALEKIGYTQSHPEMLEEAYLHSAAYAEILEARANEDENDEEEWWYYTYAPEEDLDDDEEMSITEKEEL